MATLAAFIGGVILGGCLGVALMAILTLAKEQYPERLQDWGTLPEGEQIRFGKVERPANWPEPPEQQ